MQFHDSQKRNNTIVDVLEFHDRVRDFVRIQIFHINIQMFNILHKYMF